MIKLLDNVSSVAAGPAIHCSAQKDRRSFFATVTGAGSSATVAIEVSNDAANWMPFVSLTPALGSPDGFAGSVPWPHVRANPSSITGNLTVTMGI